MHGKPRHRWEIHKLDKKSVLESKSIHENRSRHRKFTSREEYDNAVCYHPVCLICTHKTDKGIKIGGTTIHNVRYTDDTVLLAETEEDLQEILNEVNRIGKTFDKKMNAKKTKTMLVSKDITSTKVSVKIDGDIIKQTDKYNIKWKM